MCAYILGDKYSLNVKRHFCCFFLGFLFLSINGTLLLQFSKYEIALFEMNDREYYS